MLRLQGPAPYGAPTFSENFILVCMIYTDIYPKLKNCNFGVRTPKLQFFSFQSQCVAPALGQISVSIFKEISLFQGNLCFSKEILRTEKLQIISRNFTFLSQLKIEVVKKTIKLVSQFSIVIKGALMPSLSPFCHCLLGGF